MMKQLDLNQLDNSGLDRLLAYFYHTPKEVEAKHGIRFEKTFDQLDYCEMAILETLAGNMFMLVHHERAPGAKYIKIVGNVKSTYPERDLDEILATLEMSLADIHIPDEKIKIDYLNLNSSIRTPSDNTVL